MSARKDISITKLGLKVPSESKDYEEFKRQIVGSEMAFIKSIEVTV